MAITFNGQSAISGAMLGAVAGVGYALVASPARYRSDDATHYALLFASVGAVVGLLVIPNLGSTL